MYKKKKIVKANLQITRNTECRRKMDGTYRQTASERKITFVTEKMQCREISKHFVS